MTYNTKEEMQADTKPKERKHFMQCEGCGKWFDRRLFDDVVFHCFGHKERQDFNVKPGVRIR